jgi:sterol desaturase/sphingolipid hydroxylase (fatty acid hydroxylase superfamily)
VNSGKKLIATLVAFLLLSTIFLVIERLAGGSGNRHQPVLRRGWLTDVIYLFGTTLLTKPLVRLLLVVPLTLLVLLNVGSPDEFKAGAYRGFGLLSRQPVWLQAVQIYVLIDFCGYWTHRLFHRGVWWPFHAVHHSSEDLNWLGSVRVHPVNEIVNKLAQVTPVLLLGYNPAVTLTAAPVLTFFAIFLHANVNWDFGPLRSVLASPVFHRWHHSREHEAWDKNFAGLLPLWDIVFGTYYMPKGRFPEDFGIFEPMPQGYFAQLWEPFAVLVRRQKKADPQGADTPGVKPAQ